MLMKQRINWDKINVINMDFIVIVMDLGDAAIVDSIVEQQEVGIEELY